MMSGNVNLFWFTLTAVIYIFRQIDATSYDPEASITGLYTGPYFDPLAPRNFTAHVDDQAILPCTVRQLGDKSVSWVRMRDADILTVDRYTFVGDERFESHYSAPMETWNLVIRYVQERDAGSYECQVSTEPKMSQFFSLRVVVPKVTILPAGDRYVKAGSQVRIDCQITEVVQLPDYIFWYHEDKRVMDHLDPNIVVTLKNTGIESITSTMIIRRVPPNGSGNYTCMPSNLHSASVILHVLNEKHPAAMQGEYTSSSKLPMAQPAFMITLLMIILIHRIFSLDLNGKNTHLISNWDNTSTIIKKNSKRKYQTQHLSYKRHVKSSLSSISYLPKSPFNMDEVQVRYIWMVLEKNNRLPIDEHFVDTCINPYPNRLEIDTPRQFSEMENGSRGVQLIRLNKVGLLRDLSTIRVLEVALKYHTLTINEIEGGKGPPFAIEKVLILSKKGSFEVDLNGNGTQGSQAFVNNVARQQRLNNICFEKTISLNMDNIPTRMIQYLVPLHQFKRLHQYSTPSYLNVLVFSRVIR